MTQALKMAKATPGALPTSLASLAVAQAVRFDPTKAVQALTDLYDAAAGAGGGRTTTELLDQAGITIKGISDTAMNRVSDAIANGLAQGQAHGQIADAINSIILDPARADVIAITEGNRAMNAAFVDQLASQGETQFLWENDADPCPECEEQLGVHDIGDPPPPLHPSCRCIAVEVPAGEAAA